MEGKISIRSVRLENFLSYGSEGQDIELQPLNVLIGPNASGKSNFIEAFRFLRSIPPDPTRAIRDGGGTGEYLWKGRGPFPTATIEITMDGVAGELPLRYRISFTEKYQRFQIVGEAFEYVGSAVPEDGYRYPVDSYGLLKYSNPLYGQPNVQPIAQPRYLSQQVNVDGNRSVLSMFRDPDRYPILFRLESLFSGIQSYPVLDTGRYSPVRLPQKADLPTDVLWEDASNLGLILNNAPSRVKQQIAEMLNRIYDSVEEIHTIVTGGTVQIFVQEKRLPQPTPAIRLSEGMLRYLCILTLLFATSPPPLICIEEPEIGLHPDVIHLVAELLVEASQRAQLIVATHSSHLVSALSDIPEAILICERDDNGTSLRRLEAEPLQGWLERYSLGDLWLKGELGGTRW